MSTMRTLAEQLALTGIILVGIGKSPARGKQADIIIYDEVVDPVGEHLAEVLIQARPTIVEPVVCHIKPNNYAGDSWRRQGKRKGRRR